MQTELERQHARHKRFHSAIAFRASQLQPIVKRTYEIPNTPYGVPKRLPASPVRINLVIDSRPLPDTDYDEAWHLQICGCVPEPPPPRVTIREIQKAVCKHFRLSLAELLSDCRQLRFVRPRQAGFYLAREFTRKSLPEIGRAFGGRDHTTVLHGLRKMDELIYRNDPVADDIDAIRETI